MSLRSKSRVKLLLLLLAWMWCLPLAAAPASGKSKFLRKESIMVAFSQDTFANDWRLAQVNDLKREMAKVPRVKFVVTDGKGSTAQQIRDIEDLIDSGVDILIASPRDSKTTAPVLARAYRMGIPVILLTRVMESKSYTTWIGPDDEAIGRKAALHLNRMLRGKGRILVFQGVPTTSTTKDRTEAFLKELKRRPKLQVAAIKVGNYLRADAVRGMEEVLSEKIPFDAIYSQSDSMASGVRLAMRGAGLDPRKIPIVGVDYIAEARTAIRRGEQSASFTYPTCAKEAAEVVAKLVAGKRVPKRIMVPSRKVTAANVNKIKPIF